MYQTVALCLSWPGRECISIQQTVCLTGTYTNQYSNQADDDCMPCTAGMYCAGWGRPLPNDECDEGWFCHAGSTAAQPNNSQCLAGHRCPRGSPDQVPCPSGEYQPYVEQGVCLECPAGKYCDQNEAIDEEQSGVGAPSHGVVTPKDCPAGKLLILFNPSFIIKWGGKLCFNFSTVVVIIALLYIISTIVQSWIKKKKKQNTTKQTNKAKKMSK